MKIIVISDIHGSLYYIRKIKDIIDRSNVDKIILLGDLYYHGPRNPLPKDYEPKKVAEILNSYKDSDLCGFIFTLNGLENLFKLLKDIYDKNGWIMNNKNLPILFIAGKDDPIIVSHDKWRKSQQFLRDLGYTNVSGKLYDNLRHELLNEKENKEVYEDIVNFLY